MRGHLQTRVSLLNCNSEVTVVAESQTTLAKESKSPSEGTTRGKAVGVLTMPGA